MASQLFSLYLSNLFLNIFVEIVKYICQNCKMYLSKLQNIFVQIVKYICPTCKIYFQHCTFCILILLADKRLCRWSNHLLASQLLGSSLHCANTILSQEGASNNWTLNLILKTSEIFSRPNLFARNYSNQKQKQGLSQERPNFIFWIEPFCCTTVCDI